MRGHRWTVLAGVWTLAVITVSFTAGESGSESSGLLAVVPMMLAVEWFWMVVGLAAIPLIAFAGTNSLGMTQAPLSATVLRVVGVGLGALIGMYSALYRQRHAATLAQTQAVAETAQRAILSEVPNQIGLYGFTARYHSAASEALVGGDFYRVLQTPFGARLLVGDVQGKGLDAVHVSSAVLGCFHEWASELNELEHLVARLDQRVAKSAPEHEFVTAIVACLRDDMVLEIANCGHPDPVLFFNQQVRFIAPPQRSTPLGLGPMPTVARHQLRRGDRILFYTDSLVETRDRDGRFIPLDELLRSAGSAPFDNALDTVWGQLASRAREVTDDTAMLMVECQGERAEQPRLSDLDPAANGTSPRPANAVRRVAAQRVQNPQAQRRVT
jgi:hypothetical protein